MASNPFGTVFVEFDLDTTRYMKGQRTLLAEAQNASSTLEKNFHNLGIKSDATFDMMRSRASLAYQAITNDARSSFGDRLRAQQAYSVAAQRIDLEQFSQEKNLHEQRKQMSRDSQSGWLSMMKGMLAYRVILSGIMGVQEAFAGTFRYLAQIETAQLGIASAFMTSGKYIDIATGKALTGAAALRAAQIESKNMIEELKAANLTTIATLDQLVVAYQQTLPVAMAKGFDKRMVKEFTLAMVQAAGAIGLPFEQLGEEVRSLLTGAINPRTSRIATVLGLRNEDIAEYKNNAQGLFDFLMDKLKAYQVAGVESQTTWAGLWSNMKDIAFQYLGEGMTPLFEGIKRSLTEITNSMIVVDDKTKKVNWDPEFVKGMKDLREWLTLVIADFRRLAAVIDLAGMGMAGLVAASNLGQNQYWNDMYESYRKRVQFQMRALADMAQAQEGYKRATKETPGAVDYTTPFTEETLWYVKETAKATKYVADDTKKVSDEAKKLGEEWEKQARTLNADIAKEGLDKYQEKVIDIRRQVVELTEKYKTVPGAKAKIGEWGASKERDVIIDQEVEIAKAVEKIRKDQMKAAMDYVKWKIAEEDKYYKGRDRALKEYEKIVTEANDWNISDHQRAINKIQSDESKHIKIMEEAYAKGYYGEGAEAIQKLLAGIDAVRRATAIATAAQIQKQMNDEVNFYSQLTDYASVYYEKKLALIEKERVANALLYGEKAAQVKAEMDIREAAAKKWDLDHAGIKSMIGYTNDLLDSTMSMFNRESKEYKALMTLKNVAHVAEMGMNVAKAASALSVAMAQNAANTSVATTGAAASVAAQGSVPVAGFALAAAMAAFMASILAASGIAWGGASAGSSAPVLPPSTVLGAEAGTGSESVSKSWDFLKEIDTLQYRELVGIHDSMKDLNNNITALVTSIVRTGGVGGFSDFTPSKTLTKFGTYGESIDTNIEGLWGPAKWVEDLGNWFMNTVVGGIFGGGEDKSLAASGIEFKAAKVGDLIAGAYVDAVQYALIQTVHSGGWFHSDWTSWETLYKALDEDTNRLFTLVFKNMSASLVELAKGLGADVQKTLDYIFKGEQISLQGKTGEEINKTLSEYFSKIGDEAVKALFGDILLRYQKLDEGLLETAARLMMDKAIVSGILSMTNQQFTATTASMIAFSEALIKIAGGLDKLQEAAGTYYDKFFTDAEKQARLQTQLTGALGDMGMALPGSRAGYRGLVEGLDLTTDAGKQAYVMLMNFAGAADQYYSAVEDATGGTDKLTEALKRQSETIQKWLADLNKSTLAPVMSAQAQEAAYATARGAAFAPGATEAQTSAFLTAANDYLKFTRAYSGDYVSVYQSVVGDVRDLANLINAILGIPQDNGLENFPVVHGAGGLTNGPTISGEMGREWNVPTYEPQRSRFLESAPPQFWENLRGAGVVQPGGGGDITIRLVNVLDGKVLSDSVAKHIPRNANLSDAIRRVN